jgi:hypothetical protein
MSAKSRRDFWSRDDVRLAAVAVIVAMFGLEIVGAIIWIGLMLWQREFRRRFTGWYKGWVLAGLVVTALVKFPLANALNVPPSWIALVVCGGAVFLAVRYQPKRPPYRWR